MVYVVALGTEATQFFCRTSRSFSYDQHCVQDAGWAELAVGIVGCCLGAVLLVRGPRVDCTCSPPRRRPCFNLVSSASSPPPPNTHTTTHTTATTTTRTLPLACQRNDKDLRAKISSAKAHSLSIGLPFLFLAVGNCMVWAQSYHSVSKWFGLELFVDLFAYSALALLWLCGKTL